MPRRKYGHLIHDIGTTAGKNAPTKNKDAKNGARRDSKDKDR